MSKITQITVTYSYTFNLGDFKSIRPEVSLTAELGEKDEPGTVQLDLEDNARQQVQDIIDDELMRLGRAPHFDKERGAYPSVGTQAKVEPDEVSF